MKKGIGCGSLIVIALAIIAVANIGKDNNNLKVDKPASNNVEQAAENSPDVPIDYTNALKKAKIYSDTQHMSKIGIYNQLTSEYGEQFTPEEAQYAIDNLAADYNKNALEKAKHYQQVMAMSIDSIYEQLISEYGEQFTPEEAQYAIDNLG